MEIIFLAALAALAIGEIIFEIAANRRRRTIALLPVAFPLALVAIIAALANLGV